MSGFGPPEWGEVFIPDGSLLESFLRGTVVYLGVLLLFRVVLRRQSGAIGLPDVMLLVLTSECVSPALTGNAKSVPNGLAVMLAVLFWNFALDWLSYRWPRLSRLLEPPPLVLVREGVPIREHLQRERISDDELAAQLRLSGIEDVDRVQTATLESEGGVSVVTRDAPPPRLSVEEATARLIEAADTLKRAIEWHAGQSQG